MHTINYVPKLSLVTLYGGRNDSKKDAPILSDLWILKLSNLEWVKVQIGGPNFPTPRCNHTVFVQGTELIILGGQGENYKLRKDVERIQLEQDRLDKSSPYIMALSKELGVRFSKVR